MGIVVRENNTGTEGTGGGGGCDTGSGSERLGLLID